MPEIHAARRAGAQQKIAEAGADAALITAAPNVRYLTGLASSNAALLLLVSGTGVLATDSRYALAAQRDCPDLELITERFIEPALAAVYQHRLGVYAGGATLTVRTDGRRPEAVTEDILARTATLLLDVPERTVSVMQNR